MAFENDFEIGPSDTPSRGFNRVAIVAEIHAERDRQDAQWGGPERLVDRLQARIDVLEGER